MLYAVLKNKSVIYMTLLSITMGGNQAVNGLTQDHPQVATGPYHVQPERKPAYPSEIIYIIRCTYSLFPAPEHGTLSIGYLEAALA